MPYIKKIKISGFKSFSKTVTITLDKGFTVLTGPNGSGKSNILDAILFGLGELSSRKLRSEKFAELMFKGGSFSGVKKQKNAKVVIQFDNSDHRIPINLNTVTISREVTQNGQSVYQLNGRRTTRSHIVDMLSIAGISPTSHNVVMQGTVTRMTDISPVERRKTIEKLIGIAQYDAEKIDAEEKLQEADISIRTAMGQIGEVQKRVNDLERERNEMLRYNFIQNKIVWLNAIKISNEIEKIEKKVSDYTSKSREVEGKVDKLRQIRGKFRSQRQEVKGEWRKFTSEFVDEGSIRVFEAQRKIGELKTKLSELTIKIDVGTDSLKGFGKTRAHNIQQLKAIDNEIAKTLTRMEQVKKDQNQLSEEIANDQFQYDTISKEIVQIRANSSEKSKKIQDIEKKISEFYQKLLALRSEHAQGKATIKVLSYRLKNLSIRRKTFQSTLNELDKSLLELKKVGKEQKERLKTLQKTLDRRIKQKKAIEEELTEAEKVANSAREAVVEFVTQRELAEKVTTEEKALSNIEELGNIGAIDGVYGRLRNLIGIEGGYEKTIEAAASGWLDSIVVRDFDVAFTCTETLKRLKLSRIKIIPIQETSNIKLIKLPKIEGINGVASTFVKYEKAYEPAVIFVFGDTLTTKDERTALIASQRGFRTVTINGDLFEAGGGMESGYYRAPIDFTLIIPSEPAVESLDLAVKTLQGHLAGRETDIITFTEEINKAQMETSRLIEATTTLNNEITRISRTIKRNNQDIKNIINSIQRFQELLKEEKTQIVYYRTQRTNIQKEMQNLRTELNDLQQEKSPSRIQEMEIQREKLGDKIIKQRQKLVDIETEYSTLQSKLENVLKGRSDNIKIQLASVEQQFSTLEREVNNAFQLKVKLEKELLDLEESEEEMSHSYVTSKEEVKKYTSQIDDIDKQLHQLDTEYEQANGLLNKLQLNSQTSQLQLDQRLNQLMEFGYEKPLKLLPEQLVAAESSLYQMQLELKRLGAVNQLALTQFAEQISRYKELSLHINELEQEKQAILIFMDEIERKKHMVFMNAFNKINESLSLFFSKLTEGGEAALILENGEDPFNGGIDMIVQFPSKPPIIVSGASGGERSISAVAFIFALQEFLPAAFYIFDEIDAHLDAFHVEKLGKVLIEESGKSQFLVISLKPELVSKAEGVFGIYAQEGVSHVVSTTFERIVKREV